MTAKSREFTFLNGKVLSLHDQVAVALRRLSSGDSLVTVADSFGLNHSTVSQVTWRFVEAMEEKGLQHLKWPSSELEMMQIKSKFENIQGLPNCCGVVETTHIMMLLPSSDTSSNVWLDNEKNHSMVLQAVVDPEMRFLDIVTGWPGKMQDWVGKDLSEPKAEFNKRLSATQMVANRALARLKDMWRIIHGVMWRPDKHRLPRIILVCCLLHNIAIDLEDEAQSDIPLSHQHDPDYQQQTCESVDIKVDYSQFTAFLTNDNSFLTPWSWKPDDQSDGESNTGEKEPMVFQPGSFFDYDVSSYGFQRRFLLFLMQGRSNLSYELYPLEDTHKKPEKGSKPPPNL
ncbi:hypothetical protein GH714_013234 [Hevea brasiliensis]|uniref:DDE Tnp4 domain-containing protein n=1 Tax=Hevea brasiliensis TaxID=3981 RepID=A0A6A6LHF7_HEVBR|nr:hypothetical protein GH714_013234 [Hevea brasiliensis]